MKPKVKKIKHAVDKILTKLVSRKLLVWLTTVFFVFIDKVDADNFVAISLAYIGIQGIADIATRWKHGLEDKRDD